MPDRGLFLDLLLTYTIFFFFLLHCCSFLCLRNFFILNQWSLYSFVTSNLCFLFTIYLFKYVRHWLKNICNFVCFKSVQELLKNFLPFLPFFLGNFVIFRVWIGVRNTWYIANSFTEVWYCAFVNGDMCKLTELEWCIFYTYMFFS